MSDEAENTPDGEAENNRNSKKPWLKRMALKGARLIQDRRNLRDIGVATAIGLSALGMDRQAENRADQRMAAHNARLIENQRSVLLEYIIPDLEKFAVKLEEQKKSGKSADKVSEQSKKFLEDQVNQQMGAALDELVSAQRAHETRMYPYSDTIQNNIDLAIRELRKYVDDPKLADTQALMHAEIALENAVRIGFDTKMDKDAESRKDLLNLERTSQRIQDMRYTHAAHDRLGRAY